uniref:Zinc-finger type transcription factor n=1 Tax=Phyllostachys edulis TaxID=38705 RepID=D3KYU0_PHYED|nr:Zinc-finger type transcription factor [Phyllostachys edulis]
MNYNFGGNVYEQEVAGGEGSCPWARPCDGCNAAPSVVYCRADAAYLCASCDSRVHAANRVATRHERVRVCEACERAPAVLACRADAAVLCVSCDAQVHSANPLARRHQRVPVVPLPAAAIPAASVLAEAAAAATTVLGDKEEEVDSWLLLSKDSDNQNCSSNNNNNSMYFGEVDEYFDLVGYNSYYDNRIDNNQEQYGMQEQQQQQQQEMQKEFAEKEGSECVVPSQVAMVSEQQQQSGYVGAEQAASMTAGVSAYTDSISNSISFSSMEVGIVPDNTVIDMPNSSILTPAGAINLFSGPSLQMPLHLSTMDREARVLRYKEKKKTRKFEKTIRYATRKAYAEARPRIKGRFAKRSDVDIEVDQMFSSAALSDCSYGTVPWF